MYSLFNEPRSWKWMVPAALIFPSIWWRNDWTMGGDPWKQLAIIPGGLVCVLGIAAFVNLGLYAYHHWAQMYEGVQLVRNSTPEVRMFEAAKGMHPEAVKALLVHRRSIWRIKYVPLKDTVDWIFDELPTVHAGFVDFVLDHSNARSVMSKRLLSDGSKQFDPEELVTDYQQYEDLVNYMQVKLICTQAYGNQAPQWLPPWNPEVLRHRFGLDGAPYAVEEEGISEAMQSVLRAQAKWQGNGVKEMGITEPTPAAKPTGYEKTAQSTVSTNGNGNQKVADVTDEEWQAVQAAMDENKKDYQPDANLKGVA
jgi:hypothetical protein